MPKEKRKMMIGLLKNGNIQFCQFQFVNWKTRIWKEVDKMGKY